MSEFIIDNKLYYHSIDFALSKIGGSWKMPILNELNSGNKSYKQLKAKIPQITDELLSNLLFELQKDGLISNHSDELYFIEDLGQLTLPIIDLLKKFGERLMKSEGIPVTDCSL